MTIKVMQTRFRAPKDDTDESRAEIPLDERGDCFRACVASIIGEADAEKLPNYCWIPGDWWPAFAADMRSRGLQAIYVTFGCQEVSDTLGGDIRHLLDAYPMPDLFWIASGKSPRGDFWHSVVYKVSDFWHDPHPDGTGLDGPPGEAVYLVREP